MTLQYSVSARNQQLNAITTAPLGTSGIMPSVIEIRTGAIPASCAAASTGTALANWTVNSPMWSTASGGAMVKNPSGTWTTTALATGTAGYWRVMDVSAFCYMQGSVGITGSGADMILDSLSFTNGQAFSVLTFTITEGNA